MPSRRGLAVAIAYEGCDAAGKGGNIKRITEALDPRGYEVHPIGAPSPGSCPFIGCGASGSALAALRRYRIRHLRPHVVRARAGRMERRVEKFAKTEEWQRAYREINEFEKTLTDDGLVLVKFWIHISKKRTARPFQEAGEGSLEELESAHGRGLA